MSYPRVIVISSNLCTDVFQTNNLTNFANYFSPIIASPGKTFSVKLRSIAISLDVYIRTERIHFGGEAGSALNVYRPTEKFPGYLQVLLQEVRGQISGEGYTHSLGGVAFPPTSDSIVTPFYAFHQWKHSVFLPLKTNRIDSFRINIVDADEKPIIFGGQIPTTIELELSEEMDQNAEFTITCSSYQPTIFPGNTLGQFSCPLPQPMNLQNYEVALASVVYPPELRDDLFITIGMTSPISKSIKINASLYRNTGDLVAGIQMEMREAGLEDYVRFKLSGNGRRKKRHSFFVSVTDMRAVVDVNLNFLHFVGQSVDLHNRFIFNKTGAKKRFTEGWIDMANMQTTPTALLECNILKSSPMGQGYSPLLQCIAVKTSLIERDISPLMKKWTNLKDLIYEPNSLLYTDVKPIPFQAIQFTFRNTDGTIKQLKAPTIVNEVQRIIISLVFRPKHFFPS